MASEYTDVVAAFLSSRMKGDATMNSLVNGRVYNSRIPQADTKAERDATYPCVLFAVDALHPFLKSIGNLIVWSPQDYQVVGIDYEYNGFTNLVPISARILQLLDGFDGIVPGGGYINSSNCVRPAQLAEEKFNRLGYIVNIKARLAA